MELLHCKGFLLLDKGVGMILTDMRKVIDKIFQTKNYMDAIVYSQGYIDGVKHAPRYGVLNSNDWNKLCKYIQDCSRKKLDIECDTKKIMEKVKG